MALYEAEAPATIFSHAGALNLVDKKGPMHIIFFNGFVSKWKSSQDNKKWGDVNEGVYITIQPFRYCDRAKGQSSDGVCFYSRSSLLYKFI